MTSQSIGIVAAIGLITVGAGLFALRANRRPNGAGPGTMLIVALAIFAVVGLLVVFIG